MAMTADPEHRWACCKIMQRNKVHILRKIEIGAVIMAPKEAPIQTIPITNNKDNKKNSLTRKLQTEIQCQNITTIINRYKHREGWDRTTTATTKIQKYNYQQAAKFLFRIVSLGIW